MIHYRNPDHRPEYDVFLTSNRRVKCSCGWESMGFAGRATGMIGLYDHAGFDEAQWAEHERSASVQPIVSLEIQPGAIIVGDDGKRIEPVAGMTLDEAVEKGMVKVAFPLGRNR